MEDNRSDPIMVPGQIPVFGQRYSSLYVSDYALAHNCLVQSRVHGIFLMMLLTLPHSFQGLCLPKNIGVSASSMKCLYKTLIILCT